ncbi:GAF and ANTAR domain-containing protein [Mycolicibacterium sp. 018/SC-01/001]|uniref:GAF and ANTAR domain-containing protein n=1 Tax=Mycolicibacterium sp. 018/SC-01/001 TaxID=2592069 RepID=UPI00210457A1|nr:GAF and ANTAR domain-containing protein [Mycolicibacterium sp. 018/SC-01/001]
MALLDLTAISVASVPGARFAGTTVFNTQGKSVTTLAATHPLASVVDEIQFATGEGPCLSAAWNHHTIVIDDMATETRWPRFQAQTMVQTPIRSVMSFRLFDDGQLLAALNFFAESAGVFDEESVELGLIFAAHLAVAWSGMNREQHFRSALASRDIIGQAKGMLMERFDITAPAAFELLRRLSQESNTKLHDVAERIVSAGRQRD